VAREYVLAEAVIDRLSRLIDRAVLEALLRGVELDLRDEAAAAASARSLGSRLTEPDVTVELQFDEKTEAYRLLVRRMLHGNQRTSVLDRDFLESGDYAQIQKTAGTLQGLLRPGAFVQRGEEKKPVQEFREAIDWLEEQVKNTLTIQRYKGLGEMNPTQLWETTMDPGSRRLLRAQIEDAIAADEIFTTLMGDMVEPRRAFIEANALGVRNLDV
jgi:DNA gyrase subunit B